MTKSTRSAAAIPARQRNAAPEGSPSAADRRRSSSLRSAHLFEAYDGAYELELGDAIRLGVDAWFAFAQARPDGMRLLFGEDAGAASPIAAETTEAIIQRIATVTEHFASRGGRDAGGAAPLVAAMIVGACVYAIRRCLDDPSLDPEAVSAMTTSFLAAAATGFDPELYRRFG